MLPWQPKMILPKVISVYVNKLKLIIIFTIHLYNLFFSDLPPSPLPTTAGVDYFRPSRFNRILSSLPPSSPLCLAVSLFDDTVVDAERLKTFFVTIAAGATVATNKIVVFPRRAHVLIEDNDGE